ncbi:DEAD/DEAH box helicase [Paenibacillus riograndensis]|uniref:DEAD/DEAH box helicase n=1 Tax=Paenibacillus riograndensis TaxID=483937 RepID=UPI001E30565B|nr:DEAD/DEAH box helicase [Paenibacillus riograndensis]
MKEIRETCGDTFYKRGKAYYEAGRVHNLECNEIGNCYTAEVKGSKSYKVRIEFDEEAFIVDSDCACPAFKDYGSCKHEAATLIAISRLGQKDSVKDKPQHLEQTTSFDLDLMLDSILKKQTAQGKPAAGQAYKPAEQLISSFSESNTGPAHDSSSLFGDAEQLQFEFILKTGISHRTAAFSLEMRVGVKRLYVVSKINRFLEHVEQHLPYYFTSHFTFDPKKQQINPADLAFLNALILIKNTEKVYRTSAYGYYDYAGTTDGRAIAVPPLGWEKLKPLLSEVNVVLGSFGQPGTRAELINEAPPFSFSIGKGGPKDYVLSASGIEKCNVFPEYSSMIVEGKIYSQDPAALHRIEQLQQTLSASKGLAISSQQIEPFIQRVVPALRELGAVKVDKTVQERIIQPELQCKIYLDYTEGKLLTTLEFHYGDIVIDPLSSHQDYAKNGEIILVRNVQKEDEIIGMLDRSSMNREGRQWVSASELGMYEALHEFVPSLEEYADIYLTAAAQNLIMKRQASPKVRADLNEGLDWLHISFEMEGLDEKETTRVMQAIVEKKKYIRLRSGAFLSLQTEGFHEFRTMADRLNLGKKDLKAPSIQLPSVHALQLPERRTSTKAMKWGKSLRLFLDQLKEPENMDFELPGQMKDILRDYQVKGFQWMKTLSRFRFGGILADDMGLGKTIQSIAYICSELEENPEKTKILIICPASLTYNWANEFASFAPEVKILVAAGQKEERSELLDGIDNEEAQVIITSYPLLRRDIDLYSGKSFHTLILDEAQAVKNAASQTAQAVKSIKAARKFALTGTPIENSIDELESIIGTVSPLLFSGRQSFRQLPADRISSIVAPFILRRLKKDVLEELPDRIETVQRTELLLEQKQLYLAYLSKLREDTEQDLQGEGFQKSRMKILAGITRLRQLCCHPSLFVENYTGGSGKLDQLLELVEGCRASGKRMLVFSQFSSMLQLIRESLTASGIIPFYLDGSTPAGERVELCRRFNEGEGEVFLISLKAGGTGLNLTGADTVILYDLWWNPAVEEQAVGRAHRMGQRHVVQVIRMITEGTIEEKILELQQRKKNLIEEIIESGENKASRLSEEDIRELLKM